LDIERELIMNGFTLEESAILCLADEFGAAQGYLPTRFDYFAILEQQRHAQFLNPTHVI
jgi:hypothetical protein